MCRELGGCGAAGHSELAGRGRLTTNRNRGVCAVSYPVTFEADYAEQRNRLTTFFRLILVIPVAVVLYVFGIVASIAIVIAWFAIVITGRYPQGLYSFVADFNRFLARVTAYAVLLTDPYPPFSGADDPAYPVRMSSRDRWRATAA